MEGKTIKENRESDNLEKINESGLKRHFLKLLKDRCFEIICCVVVIIGSYLFFLYNRTFDPRTPLDHELWGTYGDCIICIAATIIAYRGVDLLSKNLKEQIRANEELKKGNDANNKIAATQQFEQSFSTMLSTYLSNRKEIEMLCNEFKDKRITKNQTNITNYKQRVLEAVKIYTEFYTNKREILAPHFRLLFRILETIDEFGIDEYKVKRRAAKFLRSQLSEGELLLLRYNAYSHYGVKLREYINKYNILKHLPKTFLIEYKSLILETGAPEKSDIKDFDEVDVFFLYLQKALQDKIIGLETDISKIKYKNLHLTSIDISPTKNRISLQFNISETQQKERNRIEKMIKLFAYELVVFTTFEKHQKYEDVKINSEIKQNNLNVCIKRIDEYSIILSNRQMDSPQ